MIPVGRDVLTKTLHPGRKTPEDNVTVKVAICIVYLLEVINIKGDQPNTRDCPNISCRCRIRGLAWMLFN
jgi:hypothetical protein